MKKKMKLPNETFIESMPFSETEVVFVDFKKKQIKGTIFYDHKDGSNMAFGSPKFIKEIEKMKL